MDLNPISQILFPLAIRKTCTFAIPLAKPLSTEKASILSRAQNPISQIHPTVT